MSYYYFAKTIYLDIKISTNRHILLNQKNNHIDKIIAISIKNEIKINLY